ncbi:unnamed protein product [Brachionus calyciflorus]|uniref:Tafazzin family protein n=1 Tax=Brachionus calyciflorus TaxID=104777 RepID=A0A813SW47_9BILA|nr:unnamed protein product [Brachionus calyciflorus]
MNDWSVSTKFSKKWRLTSSVVSFLVGCTSRLFAKHLNKTKVVHLENFNNVIYNRPKEKPLITVCNHYSCCDDPVVFGAILPFSTYLSPQKPHLRWSLAAREVCFSKPWHSLLFRLGKVLPIDRGHGVYQPVMNQILEELEKGDWLHIFPEGKVNETKEHIRLKWGVGRLVADSKVTPIVLPFYHYGLDDILPNRKPYVPQIGQKATIVFGKPIYFDDMLKELREKKLSSIEIRKKITDKIEEEYYLLKEYAKKYHDEHLNEK